MRSLRDMYLLPFHLLAAGIQVFSANRRRFRLFLGKPRVAATLKLLVVATTVIWLGIAVYFGGQQDNAFDRALKQWFAPLVTTPRPGQGSGENQE